MPKSLLQPHILAMIFALINAFMLAAMSLFAKKLAAYFGPMEVTFFRNIFSVIALFGWLYFSGTLHALRTNRPWAHLFRGIIGTVGIVLGAWALSMMPLSETTILLFTSPLFVVLLSYPVLGERVGKYRLGAVAVGFIGVLITINPTASAAQSLPLLGVMAGLLWGFSSGCVDICLRWMGRTENSMATVFYFVLFGSLTTGLHLPFATMPPQGFSIEIILIIFGLGLSGLLSLLAKTQSFKMGEATMIAPIMYTMIIWTMLFDYIFWGKAPTINVIAGATLIIASNIFIIYRENKLKLRQAHLPTD